MFVRIVVVLVALALVSQLGPVAAMGAVAPVETDLGGSANETESRKFGDDNEESAASCDLAGCMAPDARPSAAGPLRLSEAGFARSVDRPPAKR